MFRIMGGGGRYCDGVTRRSFLQAGVLGVGGLGLADYLRARERREGPNRARRNRQNSVILFWLSGGPGHMETWDPKPEMPELYRGPFGAIPTSVPGVQFLRADAGAGAG